MSQQINTKTSRLLELSPELRKSVYKEALTFDDPITIPCQRPALLQVCRKIRHEATAMYYSNRFHHTFTTQPDNLQHWFATLPEHVRPMIGVVKFALQISEKVGDPVQKFAQLRPTDPTFFILLEELHDAAKAELDGHVVTLCTILNTNIRSDALIFKAPFATVEAFDESLDLWTNSNDQFVAYCMVAWRERMEKCVACGGKISEEGSD